MLKPATSEVGVDLVQLSLVCDGEDKVKEVLMAGCWVVLEHVECSGSDWQRSLKQIMEVSIHTSIALVYYCFYRIVIDQHKVTSGYHYH